MEVPGEGHLERTLAECRCEVVILALVADHVARPQRVDLTAGPVDRGRPVP